MIAMVTGVVLGLVLALMKMSRIKVLTALASLYIEIIRGTPLIVQALIMAYGLPAAAAVQRHFVSLAVFDYPCCHCVRAQQRCLCGRVIRSGIQAVDKGQMEAARSIGMTKGQAMKLIVIPQALKIVLPAFGNEFVSLIKETSVLSYVGVVEILRKGALWNAATFNTFEAYIGVALVYMLLTIPTSKLVKRLEKTMASDSAN